MILLVLAALLTVAFNFLLNQSLDFEERSTPVEFNTRRSFRPLEHPESTKKAEDAAPPSSL